MTEPTGPVVESKGTAWTLPLTIGAVVLAGLSLLPGLFHDPSIGTLRAANGRSERILALTYGMSHRWQRGSVMASWLRRILPDRNTPESTAPASIRWASYSSCLVVWPETPPAPGFRYQHLLRDAHGCVFQPGGGDFTPLSPMSLLQGQPPPVEMRAALFRAYPRSSDVLEIGDRDDIGNIAWTQTRNPVPHRASLFTGAPLPQRGTNGTLAVEVQTLSLPTADSPSCQVGFQVTEAGTPSKAWRIARYLAEDSSGNRRGEVAPLDKPAGTLTVTNLCRKEAWRLSLDLLPAELNRTPPDQVFELPRVAYPIPGKPGASTAERSAMNTHVAVRRIAWITKPGGNQALPAAFISVRNPIGMALAVLESAEGSTPTITPREIADTVGLHGSDPRWDGATAWVMRDAFGAYPFKLPPAWSDHKDLRLKLYFPRTVEIVFQP